MRLELFWNPALFAERLGAAAQQFRRMLRNQAEILQHQGAGALITKLDNKLHWQDAPPIPQGRVRGAVSAGECIRITREATVTVGVSRVSTPLQPDRRPLRYSRLRDIEAPMLGACYLTEWTEGVERLYELGAEIETYRTPEEMVAKLAELSGDSRRRNAMRERAQRRALSDYSVPRTLKRISEMLF